MKITSSLHVIALVAASTALSSCSKSPQATAHANLQSVEARLVYNQPFFGHDINLVVTNPGSRPVCFPHNAIAPTSPYFQLKQNSSVIPPNNEKNREVVTVNGVDVAGGIEVVPSGKTRNFYLNINDFDLTTGKFTASIRLNVLDCAELFSGSSPSRHDVQASVTGDLPSVSGGRKH